MRILVTGGGGYLGLVLCRALLDSGWKVRIVDRFVFGRAGADSLASHEPESLEVITGDIRAFSADWLADVSAMCHLAAISSDPLADFAPQEAWAVNAQPLETMVAVMREQGVKRCILASTASIYDGAGDGICTEETAVVPQGIYATSKAAAEGTLLGAASPDFAPTVLRMGTLYGPSPRMRFDLVVNAFVRAALAEHCLHIHGDGAMSRPLLAIEDAAAAFVRVLEAPRDAVRGRTFNVVSENLTVREIADAVVVACRRQKREIRCVNDPLPERVRDYRASAVEISERLHWDPRVRLGDSVERMLNFYGLLPPHVLLDNSNDNNAFLMQANLPSA